MNKILLYIFTTGMILSIGTTNAFYSYDKENTKSFINSPGLKELKKIKDKKKYICEKVFLEAYMRRNFTDLENRLCSDVFERKIEAQLDYIRYVMGERGMY